MKIKDLLLIIRIWFMLILITPFIMMYKFGEKMTEFIANKLF